MLVNCPKCGFSQPQDRYCANCGVDMQLYRPQGTPFWKKILGNPFLHVAVIFAVVLASILFIQKSRKEEMSSQAQTLKGGPVIVNSEEPAPIEVSASRQAEAEIARENSTVTNSSESPSASTTLPAPPPPPTNAMEADTSTAAAPTRSADARSLGQKAIITYAEVETAVLDMWMEEMRNAGQVRSFDNVVVGVLPQASQKIRGARGVKSLQKVEHAMPAAPASHEWFVGTHKSQDMENEMGFFSSLSITESKEGMIKGDLEVQRAFRDPKDPMKTMERISFGSPFEMAPGSAYVMRGLLPRKFVTDFNDESNPDPFLSIFNSRSFANGQTEFTLILEFDTSGSHGK